MDAWILKATNLTKRYGPSCLYCTALTGAERSNRCPICGTVIACAKINFVLKQGEVLGIVGESGSGKSTLMQIVNLSLPADVGEVWYHERDKQKQFQEEPVNLLTLDKYTRRAFRNERLGIVHQRPELGLNMKFSVGGNVAEKLLLANWRNIGRIRERTAELMRLTELPPERIDDDPRMRCGTGEDGDSGHEAIEGTLLALHGYTFRRLGKSGARASRPHLHQSGRDARAPWCSASPEGDNGLDEADSTAAQSLPASMMRFKKARVRSWWGSPNTCSGGPSSCTTPA